MSDTLRFENDFLARYRHFLMNELVDGDPTMQQETLRILQNTPFADPEIVEAIQLAEIRLGLESIQAG